MRCRKKLKTPLRQVLWLYNYNDESVKQLIAEYKYKKNPSLISILIRPFYKKLTLLEKIQNKTETIIVPVPLHSKKLRMRGFNQAELLAYEVTRMLNIPTVKALEKNQYTRAQVDTRTRRERLINIKGSFICSNDSAVRGKNIIIVDDVLTTGATIREVARVLKKSGAANISAIVLARD